MKTAKAIDGMLKSMWEKVNMDPEFEAPMNEIRAAINERDTQLKVHAESWHDDDADEFEFKAKTTAPEGDWQQKYNDLQTQHNDLRQRYADTFFNGDAQAANVAADTSKAAILDDQFTDIKMDGEPKDIDDLFAEVETAE